MPKRLNDFVRTQLKRRDFPATRPKSPNRSTSPVKHKPLAATSTTGTASKAHFHNLENMSNTDHAGQPLRGVRTCDTVEYASQPQQTLWPPCGMSRSFLPVTSNGSVGVEPQGMSRECHAGVEPRDMSRESSLRVIQLMMMQQQQPRQQYPPRALQASVANQTLLSPQAVLYLQMQRLKQQQRHLHTPVEHHSRIEPFPSQPWMGPIPNPTPGAAPHAAARRDGTPVPVGDLPACVATGLDEYALSRQQVLLRLQMEYFVASSDDASHHIRGRNKSIRAGQVGVRCRHCAHLPAPLRQKGSTYFPATVNGLYQAAQNMSATHIQNGACVHIARVVKEEFEYLRVHKGTASGAGRKYWAKSAAQIGLVDTADGIYHVQCLPVGACVVTNEK